MSKFWGLTVNVGKKFKQQVQESFCISGAALEPLDIGAGKYDEKPVLLYLQQDQNDFLLCSLSPKQDVLQTTLDVRIGSGETVGFHLKGGSAKSKVHLTGYTLPRGTATSLTTTPKDSAPFKGSQKSILVTEPKSADKQKKRVSIVETEAYGEREELESDEDTKSAAKKLFNGNQDSDEDEDDSDEDEDDNSDSDMDDMELAELQQLVQKGKYNPKTGGKLGEDEDSDDLELLEDEEDDDEDDDDDDDDDDEEDDSDDDEGVLELDVSETKKKKQKQNSQSPQKQDGTPKKNDLNDVNKGGNQKTPENKHLNLKQVQTPSSAGHTPLKSFSKGGVLVNEIKVGNGNIAKPGKMVTVYYEGRLKSNNKRFDASQSGQGFKFRLGKGEVIRGWDLGVDGMKVGGKRRLVIPAQLAYGKRGAPPDIPPNSTLVFEVELKNVS